MRLFLALVGCLLVAAAPASAARVGAGGFVVAGPVLAGTDLLWADRPSQIAGAVTVRRLTADGLVDVELTRSGCSTSLDLAASESYVALSGCGGSVAVAGINSTSDPDADVLCDGPIDVLTRYLVATGCGEASRITATDLATGQELLLPPRLPASFTPSQLRIAETRIAVLGETVTPTSSRTPNSVLVFDRGGSAPLYEADLNTLTDPATFGEPTLRLALQPDGTVLVGSAAPGASEESFAWASEAEPFTHAIEGAFARTAGRPSLAGDAFAAAIAPEEEGAEPAIGVFDLDGDEQAEFKGAMVPDAVERGIAFDGTRLGWTTRFVVVNNVALADVDPLAAAPRVAIGGPRGAQRSRRVQFVRGTATDTDGEVAEVRVGLARLQGCRRVDDEGRLRRGPGSGGSCRPSASKVAQGTSAWSFALKRRLPPGRYVVRAVARDYTGLSGTARRTFRVRR